MLTGTVLITGGAGFLGRGILRRAMRERWDCRFIVYSRDEQKHVAAAQKYPNARYIVGDILDTPRLHLVMSMCDYVIHTAAIKYIPECEAQPSEAIRVNIEGTRSVMDAARAAGVKRTVIISTDKAAGPINTYGMTKAICERLVWETVDMPSPTGALFNACRYGNVIGSTGSIWPVFKQQAARYGKLHITNPNMTRFFMSVDQAVDVILSAFTAPPGTVVIPNPDAINIGKLSEYLTVLWKLDDPLIVGARDGEKVHETIARPDEWSRMAKHGDFNVLVGPTKEDPENRSFDDLYAHSDIAAELGGLTPEKFVAIGEDSESV